MHRTFLLLVIAAIGGCLPALLTLSGASAAAFNPGCSVGSLRTALRDAQAIQGPHTINLPAGCTYRFADVESAGNPDNALPVLTRDITINGNGATFDRAAGAPAMRYLDMMGSDTLTVRNLTMRHGLNPASDGVVTAAGYAGRSVGGAVRCTNAELTLEDVLFEENAAEHGGAVFVQGCRTYVTRVTFNYNEATDGDGGALVQLSGGDDSALYITDSLFADNEASDDGGAVYTDNSYVLMRGTTVHRNVAGGDGGGLRIETGINPWVATIEWSTIARNTAGSRGGGLFVASQYETFIRYSSIWNNHARSGGGIAWRNGGEIVLTTISNNDATSDAGGLLQYEPGSVLLLNRATLANNTAPAAPVLRATGGEVDLVNTLIAYTGALPAGQLCDRVNNAQGMLLVTWTQYAMSEGPCFGANVIGAGAAALQPLDQNGGPTRSHGLGFSSVAKDAGNQAQCNTLQAFWSRDQRGEPYWGTAGAACDMGSIESQLIAVAMAIPPGAFLLP